MKKAIILLLAGIFFVENSFSAEESIKKGKMLAKRCAWCHDINRPLLAPPFRVILNRYKNISDADLKNRIVDVIKNGSKGRWKKWMVKHIKIKMGKVDDVYMPSQKPYFTDKEMKLIAEWLVSLRKEKSLK